METALSAGRAPTAKVLVKELTGNGILGTETGPVKLGTAICVRPFRYLTCWTTLQNDPVGMRSVQSMDQKSAVAQTFKSAPWALTSDNVVIFNCRC